MKNYKQKLGKFGEEKAIEYLKHRNYHILDKNFRTKYGEIDIVAENNGDIVFVEVKTRTNLLFGSPQLSVNFKKQSKLTELALAYIKSKNLTRSNIRFDVVTLADGNIELIKNAFSVSNTKYSY